MFDRIENKLIDKLDNINVTSVSRLFDCKTSEVGDTLINYFNKREYFTGNINLNGILGVKSMGKLKRIDGNLSVGASDIEDFGDLKTVEGDIRVSQCRIETTSKLSYCRSLYIETTSFEKFNNLVEINGDLFLFGTKVESLNNIQLINGKLNLLLNNKLSSLGDLREVSGDVIISGCKSLNSLGRLYHINGSLDLRLSELSSFGALCELGGYVVTFKSKLIDLYGTELDILDFKKLGGVFPDMEKIMYVNVPEKGNLKNFGVVVIGDN